MIDPQSPATHYTQASTDDGAMPPTVPWTSELDTLLAELEEATDAVASASVVDRVVDDQLVQMRLGIAASLFAVLRCKHPPTAAHMLRVALTTSAWCLKLGLDEAQRDTIEVAALLHDLGVNGIPDRILYKPGILSTDEALTVERSRRMSAVILGCSCTDPAVLDVVRNVSARYDGTRPGYSVSGEAIPLGARMIAIVESYRRDDDGSRLPQGDVHRIGDPRVVPLRRHPVRSRTGREVRRVPSGGPVDLVAGHDQPLAADAGSHGGRILRAVSARPRADPRPATSRASSTPG